ncbi:unnamed protein product, partial [Mesorhabditis belari]|uniref:Uncharacterized protein n=1 Tax=Mesorhabditis belari TaxID=2138241 RepID=A0AAF3FUX3_9BILA
MLQKLLGLLLLTAIVLAKPGDDPRDASEWRRPTETRYSSSSLPALSISCFLIIVVLDLQRHYRFFNFV